MRNFIILPIFLFLLAACSGQPENVTRPAPGLRDPANVAPPLATVPTESYPPQVTPILPEGYPAIPPTSAPPPAAYAVAEMIWILKAAGVQCETYNVDVVKAQARLENAGIPVFQAQVTNLPVCEACEVCPSSEHYRLQINSSDEASAVNMKWQREP